MRWMLRYTCEINGPSRDVLIIVLVQELYLMAQVQYTCAYLSLLYLYKYNKDK